MSKQERLVKDFEAKLEENHLRIQKRRDSIREETGNSMPKNRAKWLKTLTIRQARERLAS